MIFISYIV